MYTHISLSLCIFTNKNLKLGIRFNWEVLVYSQKRLQKKGGACELGGACMFWEMNPGPRAPEARIIPLDQTAD